MKIVAAVAFWLALMFLSAALGTLKAEAQPQPAPGCGYVSNLPWSPCYWNPPVPGRFWTPVEGIPGTMGPSGYTPIQ